MLQIQNNRICKFHWLIFMIKWLASVRFSSCVRFSICFWWCFEWKNINVCLFIFFQLKTIFINKNKSDNSVKNPVHPERSRSEFEAFSYSIFAQLLYINSLCCSYSFSLKPNSPFQFLLLNSYLRYIFAFPPSNTPSNHQSEYYPSSFNFSSPSP